jgi:hypothetical protein
MGWYVASRSLYDTADHHRDDEEEYRWLDGKR